MIFLNAESFIEESILSVIAQTREDWELILVDDGSSDASTAIAQRWAGTDGRVRYVEHDGHTNLGMSRSRNRGIAEACGDLVTFLDSDDVWMPSALAHRLRVLDANPMADALVGGTWRWYGWTTEAAAGRLDNRMAMPPTLPMLQVVEPADSFVGVYGTPGLWYVPAMCSIVIRRDRFLALGGMTDQFVGMYEDQVLYTKVLLGLRVVFDERPLSLYRQHDGSACAAAIRTGEWNPVTSSASRTRFLAWLADYVPSHSHDASVLSALRDNLNAAAPAHQSTSDEADPAGQAGPAQAFEETTADHDRLTFAALRTRARRLAGLVERRVRLGLDRRGDVAWLFDRWTRDHASGWPRSSTTVAKPRRRRWLLAARQLRELRTQVVDDATTVVALVPARRPGSRRWCIPWPTATSLDRDARRTFPGWVVSVEPVGNDRIRRALAAGAVVGDIPPVELDRHDGSAPMAWALAIEAPPGRRRAIVGECAERSGAAEDVAPALVDTAPQALD